MHLDFEAIIRFDRLLNVRGEDYGVKSLVKGLIGSCGLGHRIFSWSFGGSAGVAELVYGVLDDSWVVVE